MPPTWGEGMNRDQVMRALVVFAGGASGLSALIALRRPEALSRSTDADDTFYVQMYAARALPLAAVTMMAATRPGGRLVLAQSAAVQVVDAAIGASRRNAPMTIFPLISALVLGAAALLPERPTA